MFISILKKIENASKITGVSVDVIKDKLRITPEIEEELVVIRKIRTVKQADKLMRNIQTKGLVTCSSLALDELRAKHRYLEMIGRAAGRCKQCSADGRPIDTDHLKYLIAII